MSRRLPADLREVRLRLARDEGMAAVVDAATVPLRAAAVTELRRPDEAPEPPAEAAVQVVELLPLPPDQLCPRTAVLLPR